MTLPPDRQSRNHPYNVIKDNSHPVPEARSIQKGMHLMTHEEQVRVRLKNEYDALKRIRPNDVMTIEVAPGQRPPYVRKYIVTYNIPTYVNGGRSIQQTTKVQVALGDNFPVSAPLATVVGGLVPYHVNWWPNGDLCNGNVWNSGRWLYEYLGFIGEVLQFRPSRVNVKSPANSNAIPFYQRNMSRFPTDKRSMPLPAAKHVLKVL